jgi:hypothetical protein
MKYLKKFEELNESSERGRIERLISLGLAELDSFLRIKYSLNTGLAKRVWAFRFKEGQDLNVDSLNEPGNELAEFWPEPAGFNDDILKSSPMRMPWPDGTSYEDLRRMAQELSLAEFMDELDRILHGELQRRFGTPRYMNKQSGPIVLINTRTGEISQLEAQVQESADNASRLVALGLLNPEQVNRIEYNVNRHAISKLFDALRVPPAWQEVEPALGRTFFFVYGYDATGTVTTGLSGIPVGGEQFLTGAALDELREAGPFDEYEFMDKIIELFIDWIRTRPAEYLKDRFGFTSRPLFIRDETDALLGRRDWTPLKESRSEGLTKLLALGLVDPSTEYRVEYKVSDWFLDYMSEADVCGRQSKATWREIKNAIVTRVHIYEPRRDKPAGYMSLVGMDLFESPDDLKTICSMNLDREGLRQHAEKVSIEVIKRDFDPASSRSRILSDRERPTLIRRIGDTQWQPFTINESKRDADLMRLISLGLAKKPVYISYEINGLAIDSLISGNAVPKEERNAKWRKRMEDIVLSRTIGWWELRKPVQGDEDPTLNLDHAIVDDYYLLNDGAVLLGMLIKEDEFGNFSDDPQELHWLLSERLREGLRSRDPRLWGKYQPVWITEDGTDQWYSLETGKRLN